MAEGGSTAGCLLHFLMAQQQGSLSGLRVVACCVEHLRLVGSNAAQRQRRAVLPMRGGCAPFSSPLVTNCFLVCSTSSRAPASCRRQVEMATQGRAIPGQGEHGDALQSAKPADQHDRQPPQLPLTAGRPS